MHQDMSSVSAVILAAGHGTRMKSALPKVLHPVGGLPMLGHVLKSTEGLAPARLCVVIGEHAPEVGEVAKALAPTTQVFMQAPPQGTADAVRQAMPGLAGFSGIVFVLYADTPLVTEQTLAQMAAAVQGGDGMAVLGFTPIDPLAYGRLILAGDGSLDRIVEAKDATPQELAVDLCNSGVMAIASDVLQDCLPKIDNDNAKGEFYLTDLVALARALGRRVGVVQRDETEVLGVDSRVNLARAEGIFQARAREAAMNGGVTLLDPETVYFSYDTKIENDVTIEQNVVFGLGVRIASGAQIKAFSHLEGAEVGPGAAIGPYARLRPGAKIGSAAKVGNFVEIKKSDIGAGAKISHLSYIGDAQVGREANIGAGTITCNYDGFDKFSTLIGERAFVGSNSSLVAPVEIGAGAFIGSGSVVTKNVTADALAVARVRQREIAGWAISFRQKKSVE